MSRGVFSLSMRFFETVHGVFLDDLDAIGVLHNSRYLSFFERALGAFWHHLGWRRTTDYWNRPDALQVVRENQVEYLRPVEDVDEVKVRTSIEKLGRTSIVFGFQMLPMDDGLPFARGRRVMVKVDPKARIPSPWTKAFRDLMDPWVHSSAGPGSAHAAEPNPNEKSDIVIERPKGATPCPTVS